MLRLQFRQDKIVDRVADPGGIGRRRRAFASGLSDHQSRSSGFLSLSVTPAGHGAPCLIQSRSSAICSGFSGAPSLGISGLSPETHIEQRAFVRLAGHDHRPALAAGQNRLGGVVSDKIPFGFRPRMAADAALLEDRPHLRKQVGLGRRPSRSRAEDRRDNERQERRRRSVRIVSWLPLSGRRRNTRAGKANGGEIAKFIVLGRDERFGSPAPSAGSR